MAALVLAAAGLYGVTAYSVGRRRGEIGIRIALGAGPGQIFRLVVGQAMRLTLSGLAIGLVATYGLSYALRSMLYGAKAGDATLLGGVAAVLLATAFAASFLPARRAAAVDPVTALRDA